MIKKDEIVKYLTFINRVGPSVSRWGIVMLLLWIGTFKFSAVEAAAIRPLVENSPLMGWLYGLLSEQAVSNLIGSSEIVVALAIVTRAWYPKVSLYGSLAAAGIFLVTLSFFVTTPGTLAVVPGYPLPVPAGPGFFLVKDLILFAAATTMAAEAGVAAAARDSQPVDVTGRPHMAKAA